MALVPHPPALPGNPSDKIQHALAFATLGLLGAIAYPRLSTLRLIVMLSLFGAFIEIAQAIPVLHRDSDVLDWLTDTIACAVVLVPVRYWLRRER
jgi:VanZ family protein